MSPNQQAAKPATDGDAEESLKRLGGGRWQTRDERFTIEPQSGTWAVVDAEATDDLGLPLVRGPFRSLTDAKAAIAAARTSRAPASPLAARIERGRTAEGREAGRSRRPRPSAGIEGGSGPRREGPQSLEFREPGGRRRRPAGRDDEPRRAALVPGPRSGRSRPGAPPDRSARRPTAPPTPSRSSAATSPAACRRWRPTRSPPASPSSPTTRPPTRVAELLAEGRDEALGVRWRIVDGDGRPIVIERAATARRR